ncbi:MAG: hypothetical protein IJ244_06575 [Bacteroidaceae bacterium]|nr:hypothetical protein [Bacteroidaceae bacterium]
MSTINLSTLNGKIYFTSGMPDVTIPGTDGTPQLVTVTCDGEQLLQESLWPINNVITLSDLGELLEPYARKQLVSSVSISAGNSTSACTVLYSMVDVGISAQEFYNGYFLSILMGTKITAAGRRELLWYYGNDEAIVRAVYSDGSLVAFAATVVGGTSQYTCIDVSPDNFVTSGKQLVEYGVTAGSRHQLFEMDLSEPDCAPILEFYNSFGVWEYIYCTGTHQVGSDFKRSQARIGGRLRNYKIEETRTFKADTGFLNTAMANWAEDLFRSDEVYVVNVVNGIVQDANGGKEVVLSDSKSDRTNEDEHMPRFTFSYQYAQRIQNVLQMDRVGRIFDNTFDHTFN